MKHTNTVNKIINKCSAGGKAGSKPLEAGSLSIAQKAQRTTITMSWTL